jgi:low temperature requirement protein LtrA
MSVARRFQDWWQPPRRFGDRPERRQVTFLKLFYDLVSVILIVQLSHVLASHLSCVGVWEEAGEL